MDVLLGLLGGAAATFVLVTVMVYARAGGWGRAVWGLTAAGLANRDPAFLARMNDLMGRPPEPAPAAPAPAGGKAAAPAPPPPRTVGPVRLLAVLQAESRLIDFLLEDISGFEDKQVGQAVREIHRKAKAALDQYLVLEPTVAASEGETTTVKPGFDPAAIRLLGNVTGTPPFTGQVQHPGWRAKAVKLSPLPPGQDENVVQPAEVQLP